MSEPEASPAVHRGGPGRGTVLLLAIASGAAVSAVVYQARGWIGVCAVGAAFIVAALVAWVFELVHAAGRGRKRA